MIFFNYDLEQTYPGSSGCDLAYPSFVELPLVLPFLQLNYCFIYILNHGIGLRMRTL